MYHFRVAALLVLFLFGTALPAWCADDDDPVLEGKKASQWLEMLRDMKAPVKQRRVAMVVMSIYGPKVFGVVEGVIGALKNDADEEIRCSAAQTLGEMGEGAVRGIDPLAEALKNDKADAVRKAAAAALGRIGTKASAGVPALLAALKDQNAGTRGAAAEALGAIKPDPEEVAPGLTEALKDSDRFVRLYALAALGRFGARASAAVKPIAELLLQDPLPEVRRKAAETLAQIGTEARAAVPQLAKALVDKDTDVRRWAAIALGKMGAGISEAAPALKEAVAKDSDKFVRSHAVHALASLGKEAIQPLIECVKNDLVLEVRVAAIEELGQIGPNAKDAVDVLTIASRDGRRNLREAATEALKKIQAKK